MKPVIFILGATALPLAQTLKSDLTGEIHAPGQVSGGDVNYVKATAHLQRLFRDGRTIIGLCASGILIRALGPHLVDKHQEPPVIAVAEDGSSVVPLLGGHHGANELARKIASLCNGHAAITTASEIRFGESFDEPAAGLVLANPQDMKSATAARLSGQSITSEVTEHTAKGSATHLVYHPRTLAIGLGCERNTSPEEVVALIRLVLDQHELSPAAIACIASIDLKSDEGAIHAAAKAFNVPARFFNAEELGAQTSRLKNPSVAVEKEVGIPGVCEAAALAAAGATSDLIVEKTKSLRATCAIARAEVPIIELPGQARGILHVIGIGPGTPEWRSPAASDALDHSTDWVGYGLYLDLVCGPEIPARPNTAFPSAARKTASAMPFRSPSRENMWRSSARAMPASMPWRHWSMRSSTSNPAALK